MKKVLGRAIILLLVAPFILANLHKQPTQVALAVEIQPGSSLPPETSGLVEHFPERPDAAALDFGPASAVETGQPAFSDSLPRLDEFIPGVLDGQADSVRGLYIPGLIALRIVPQPDGQLDFISYEEDTATQFQSPTVFGVIGLLAHNFLSGRFFFQLLPGQILTIIYGDGHTEDFQVVEIHDYERLTELDLHSDFQDLKNNQTLTADQVFQLYYQGARHLTLQTCLEKDGNWNWGVRMITAFPVSAAP